MKKNRLQYITQIGTGNYNEKTAKLYTDFSLITANEEIGVDAGTFFKNMSISNADGKYKHLIVAPSGLKRSLIALIDDEIQKSKSGEAAYILFKLNSLTDRDILNKLSEASNAGVRIQLIIRGICCIAPGILGKTENISVTSIIGRYLEHARVYCFGDGNDVQIYLSSADMMTRNTERRIEIACPVMDQDIKKRILSTLKIQLSDNVKARELKSDGNYVVKDSKGNEMINSQKCFMEEAMKSFKTKATSGIGIIERLNLLLAKNISQAISKVK